MNVHSIESDSHTYRMSPFRFRQLEGRYLLINEWGESVHLELDEFLAFINYKLDPKLESYTRLAMGQFLVAAESTQDSLDLCAIKLRTRYEHVVGGPALFMVVPTMKCNCHCSYCQVGSSRSSKGVMNTATAKRVIDTILDFGGDRIKIEFQGGEPLLQFELVEFMIRYASKRARILDKSVQFVICSNLTSLPDGLFALLNQFPIYLSTSLDGPTWLHDSHRKSESFVSTFQELASNIRRIREAVGPGRISALMTVTATSLSHLPEVIDAYLELELNSLFIRSLSPYGRASSFRSYDYHDYLEKYLNAIEYIFKLNFQGIGVSEAFFNLMLARVLTPYNDYFMDLLNPTGHGLAGMIFNYNGDIYISDEGRMLGEMGDRRFRLGNVTTDCSTAILSSENWNQVFKPTVLQAMPICGTCAYLPFCGVDPIRMGVGPGSEVISMYGSQSCRKVQLVLDLIFSKLMNDETRYVDLFWNWINRRVPVDD